MLKYKFVAKVKVVNTGLDQNLNGNYFNNVTSETIFSFGSFTVTSNFEGRVPKDYSNTLSSFVRPVTLETMGLTQTQSDVIHQYNTNAVLNLDKSDLNTFVRFGSAYEFLRVSIQNIITAYPASLFMNSQLKHTGVITFTNFHYDPITNISTFRIPTGCTVNTFGLAINYGNVSNPDNNIIKNLNLSYDKYVVWSSINLTGNSYTIIGYTGYTGNVPTAANYKNIIVQTIGNPFPTIGNGSTGSIDFHIKPNNIIFEDFRSLLNDYEKYIVSQRVSGNTSGFKFTLKDPTLLDNGTISYSNTSILWVTSDNYNIDINTPKYSNFLNIVLAIGSKYDAIKTDLIARFLTPASIKTYDLTEDGKMTKLLRLYGREFDQIKQFIDSLVNINRVSYDKINNVPDQLIKNMSRTFGWNYFSLVNETELMNSFLTLDDTERNLETDLMPAEIDIELWRRTIMNTSYFWKSKGTREAIKSMFLLIGIPEPFINITEYVYTVDGKIDPNTVPFKLSDFPTNSLPYDSDGYPKAPLETSDFFFQISGDTDAGQAYLNIFRKVGFNLKQNVDNKKSWTEAGSTTRIHYSTPQYHQEDSKLVINTKEVDIALDTARGIEYDVFDYIKNTDFPANSTGYILPFSYVNISLGYSSPATQFTLPFAPDEIMGKLEVRYNGILLATRDMYDGNNIITNPNTDEIDYYITNGNVINLNNNNFAINSGNRRDVIQATFIYSGSSRSVTGITVEYIVATINPTLLGTTIPLPSFPRGDVQVTVNGIALTKGTDQFAADYILDPANSTGGSNNIIIQNPEIVSYLAVMNQTTTNACVQVAYVKVVGSNEINARNEVIRVDSFNTGKIYFNVSANKYVYKLNYKVNNASDLKFLIDGIALEPPDINGFGGDYSINQQNPYEVFLPKGIKYGSVISVYYLVAVSSYFNPIVNDVFRVGDISNLSFLEFLELIQRKMINARTRKTVTDFKGGWYPALLNVYVQYLKRGLLPESNPLHSNGYTFENLYGFLSKYNSFFQRFVDELLAATIILKRSGLLIRNTVFTKQKFTYKRGVNLYSGGTTIFDIRGNLMVQYFGDDGTMFMIGQGVPSLLATKPTITTSNVGAITQITATGGGNIIFNGGATVTVSGLVWSTSPNPTTANYKTIDGNNTVAVLFLSNMIGLVVDTTYYVRAYATNIVGTAYGAQVSFKTLAAVITPSISTTQGTAGINSINSTGGESIVGHTSIDYYAMQYRVGTSGTWLLFPVSPSVGPLGVNNYTSSIIGLLSSTLYTYRAYMIVSGVEYYGQIRQITTSAVIPVAPRITTAAITLITQTSAVGGGNVTSEGTQSVTERGIVYGLATNPTIANTKIIDGNDSIFTSNLTSLNPNTTYFVRAYAISSVDTVYGNNVSFKTLSIAIIPVVVKLTRTYQSGTGAGSESGGNITISPALSASQSVTVNFNAHHTICGIGLGEDQTYVYCKTNGSGFYSQIFNMITIATYPYLQTQQVGSVTMNQGDSVCYYNHLSTSGLAGTCVDLCLTTVNGSGGVSATKGTYEDCIKIT